MYDVVFYLLPLLFTAFGFQFCLRGSDSHDKKNNDKLLGTHEMMSYFVFSWQVCMERVHTFCVNKHQNLQYGSQSNLINSF